MRVINNYIYNNNGMMLELDNGGKILLELWEKDVFRIRYTCRESFFDGNSLMIAGKPLKNIYWKHYEDDQTLVITSEKVKLQIKKDTAAFSWYSAAELLVKEPERGGKWLDEIEVEKYIFDTEENSSMEQTGFSFNSITHNGKKEFLRKAYSTKLEFEFSTGEAIYGLGQHEDGILNYRGKSQTLYQQNRKLPMPIMFSSRGYAFFFNTCSFSAFHDDEQGSYFWSEVEDEMDYFFIYGPKFDELVARIRSLTGSAAMLPKWAYGYWQSKEHYKTQEELVNVARGYRERSIPIDVIVQDWKYWPGEQWGEKRFDPERYPDPETLLKELHQKDIKLVISVWTHIMNYGPNHQEMLDRGFLLNNKSNINMFIKEARELHWKQIQEGLLKYGIDGWWCDGTEPFDGMRATKFREEYFKRISLDVEEYKYTIDPEYINLYPLLNAIAIYEGMRATHKDKRVLNLTRACYPGLQRYGTVVWSGDITAKWEVLRRHVADGLNFCITGHSNWTVDIGAFFVHDKREECWWHAGDYPSGTEDAGYRELYVRWFQLAAFLPVFRSHGTDISKNIWCFGEPGDIFYDTLIKFNHLRYRLLPYIYSVAGMVSHKNYTMMRSLCFDFEQDQNVLNITDQYMFGPAIMVCPVAFPMYYEKENLKIEGIAKSRTVYLPAGCKWYDFWTGEKYEGGQYINAFAPLDRMPLFIKSGSIIPMGPVVQHTQDMLDAPWEIRIYPGSNGEFEIYEDAGDGYSYEQSECAWTKLIWKDELREVTVLKRQGVFAGMTLEREFGLVSVRQGHGQGSEQERSRDALIKYNGEKTSLKI